MGQKSFLRFYRKSLVRYDEHRALLSTTCLMGQNTHYCTTIRACSRFSYLDAQACEGSHGSKMQIDSRTFQQSHHSKTIVMGNLRMYIRPQPGLGDWYRRFSRNMGRKARTSRVPCIFGRDSSSLCSFLDQPSI